MTSPSTTGGGGNIKLDTRAEFYLQPVYCHFSNLPNCRDGPDSSNSPEFSFTYSGEQNGQSYF